MSFKRKSAMFYHAIRTTVKTFNMLNKGQDYCYNILQTAHRLEKGMTIRNPKALWGFEKAEALAALLYKEKNKENKDAFAVKTGEAVLAAYIAYKENSDSEEEIKRVSLLKENIGKYNLDLNLDAKAGGVLSVEKSDMIFEDGKIEDLFNKRHSIRDFSDTPVSEEEIKKAIDLASGAPSACNRQPTKVYVINSDQRKAAGANDDYYADKYLILSGCISAFSITEFNDWIVNASIFAGYLILAFQSLGLGACVCRKSLVAPSKYNNNIRKLCNIPDNEQIVLEIAIGNYKDGNTVPVSNRKKSEDIIVFANSKNQ